MVYEILSYRPEDKALVKQGSKTFLVDLDDMNAQTIKPDEAQNLMARGGWQGKWPDNVDALVSEIMEG